MGSMKYDVFIKGRSVDLVCLNEEIAQRSNWYRWFNNEEVTKDTKHHYFPNTKSMQLDFYKNQIESNRKKLQLGIVHKKDNKLIGMVSLNDIDFLNQKCELSAIAGEEKYQSFKYATEACQLIIKHAFDTLNMHKICGGTLRKEIAQWCCRVLGFKEEGIKRKEIYKNGDFRDAYIYGLLREDFYKGGRNG